MTVGLALVGQLVVLLHMGLVRHDVCAEHGELVEHASSSTRAVHADIRVAGLHDVKIDRDGDDDDHCLATTLTRSFAAHAPVVAPADVACVHVVAAGHARKNDVDAAPLAVLDVAPKQGPPHLDV